jgi:hypothetical protein
MHFKQPSVKSLLAAWAFMMLLSLGTMAAGKVTGHTSLGPLLMAGLLLITGLKALWILRTYLNLKASTTAWNAAFISFIAFLLAVIYVLYLIGLGR